MSRALIQGLAQSLFNKTEDQVADLFGEGDAFDESRVVEFFKGELATKVKSVSDNQLKRGHKDAHTSWRKAVKERASARNLELGDDLDEGALIDALLEGIKPDGKPGEITPEQIKKHPMFKQLVDEDVKGLKEELAKTAQKYEEEKRNWYAEKNKTAAITAAFDALEASKWRKGESDEEVSKRKQTITDLLRLHTNNFQNLKLENDNLFLLDENGEIKKDNLHNTLDFSKFVLELNPFGTHAFDKDKGSAGASNNGKNSGSGDYKVVDGVSLMDAIKDVTDPMEKAKIMRAYAAQMK